MPSRLSLLISLLLSFYSALAAAAQQDLQTAYKIGDRIPVSCLNRTVYVASSHHFRTETSLTMRATETQASTSPTHKDSSSTFPFPHATRPAARWSFSSASRKTSTAPSTSLTTHITTSSSSMSTMMRP